MSEEKDDARGGIEGWFDIEGRRMLSTWMPLRDLYVSCVLFTHGGVRCSDREFSAALAALGCESKRVACGMMYRFAGEGGLA